jgi:galactose oxidase-like protein
VSRLGGIVPLKHLSVPPARRSNPNGSTSRAPELDARAVHELWLAYLRVGRDVRGQTLTVQTPGASITQVTLIRFGSVTHAFDEGQRLVSFIFSPVSGGISVNLRASSNIAPPGPYMVFLVNATGVPSVGRILVLQ